MARPQGINSSKYPMPEEPLLAKRKFYQFSNFSSSISVFSSRHLGNMSLCYSDTSNSIDNRRDFLRESGLDYRDLVCAKQVHASAVLYAKEEDKGKGALAYDSSISDTDAFITDKRNLPLAIFTADCLSIFLYDLKTPAIGLAHAGWRSTKENIAAKTVNLMREKFSSRLQDLCVGFGPCIRSCCYEVGQDFRELFPGAVTNRGGRHYLDLVGINKKQILDSGVKEENIFDSHACTSCQNKEFFSFRKEGKKSGRIMSVIMLK